MARTQAKNRKKVSLSEGFLDGEEEEIQTAETTAPEVPPEDDPTNIPDEDPENDISDEPEGDVPPEDTPADDTPAATEDETGVESGREETAQETLDALQTLTANIQELTAAVKDLKDQQAAGAEEPAADAGFDDTTTLEEPPAEGDTSDISGDEGGEETSTSTEGGEETSTEGGEGEGGKGESTEDNTDFEGDEGGEGEETSEETSTTAEALIKSFTEPGKQLNENGPTLIGKVYNYRMDKLEPIVMGIVKSKIRNRIEGARKEFRAQAYKDQYGE